MTEEQVEHLRPTVEAIAGIVASKLPRNCSTTLEDLVQVGWLGAFSALRRYDPTKGAQLKTFARGRIRGSMLDLLRDQDHLSKHTRAKVKRGELSDNEIVSADFLNEDGKGFEFTDQNALEGIRQFENAQTLRSIMASANLNPRASRMLHRYYYQEMKMRDIGSGEGIKESRVSQIVLRAVKDLRAASAICGR